MIYLNIFWIVFCLLSTHCLQSQKRIYMYLYKYTQSCGTDSLARSHNAKAFENIFGIFNQLCICFLFFIFLLMFFIQVHTNWACTRALFGQYVHIHERNEEWMHGKYKNLFSKRIPMCNYWFVKFQVSSTTILIALLDRIKCVNNTIRLERWRSAVNQNSSNAADKRWHSIQLKLIRFNSIAYFIYSLHFHLHFDIAFIYQF